MNLVEALNRVFEKVLGSNTTDSKNLLDDYIGGGGGGGTEIFRANVSVTEDGDETVYTLDKTSREIIEAIDSGKIVIADAINTEANEHFVLTCGGYMLQGTHFFFAFIDALRQISAVSESVVFAESIDGYPSYVKGGK